MTSGSPLRLGIIGISEGNGHPYSWGAICNGYDPVAMETCGFPSIPRYLEQHHFPAEAIDGVLVTHVWTQDRARSEHIAQAALIGTVVDHPQDMIGSIDGLLLARDDAENHAAFAMPFLEAGLPIYVDKPLAVSVSTAQQLFSAQRYPGQLFSCTALRYARELQLSDEDRDAIGTIRHVHATAPKKWDAYAVHAIEPALLLVPDRGEPLWVDRGPSHSSAKTLSVGYSGGVDFAFTVYENAAAPISIRVVGERGTRDLFFADSFSAFRSALATFAESAVSRMPVIGEDFTLEVVRLIEAGRT